MIRQFINRYIYSLPETKESGEVLRTGKAFPENGQTIQIPSGFKMVSEWCRDWSRVCWKNDAERSIIQYVEGDVYLHQLPDAELYQMKCRELDEYYAIYA